MQKNANVICEGSLILTSHQGRNTKMFLFIFGANEEFAKTILVFTDLYHEQKVYIFHVFVSKKSPENEAYFHFCLAVSVLLKTARSA